MLGEITKVRKTGSVEWARFIEGLWLSGLRLGEGVALSWDEDAPFAVGPDWEAAGLSISGRRRNQTAMRSCR